MLVSVAALGLGCATAPVVPDVVSVPSMQALPTGQALYRLTYDSGEGRTSLKVVLRQGADGRFQVTLSDLAGRRVLSLDHRGREVVLVDHREKSFCVTSSSPTLPEVHPEELPLEAIPRVLAGRFPIAGVLGAGGAGGGDEITDAAGRRWRVTREGEALSSWALLDDQGPALWWLREADGGILSRRGGAQYRWRLVVREESSEPLTDLVPPGYAEGICDA